MVRGSKIDRRGSGPLWFVALAVVIFVIYSLGVAAATADDCGDGVDKEWTFLPPEWECKPRLAGA